jgi:REP element-mobilizing transposase RayT
MARPLRRDGPDTFHHVSNRGIAKRSLFEDDRDTGEFLDRLIREHRAGRVNIVNYCLLTTHFHLLLHSPIGQLSEAMRRIQSHYTRRFNERRDRDGPVQKGRFWSSLIDSDAYLITAMRYIDANAVSAGIVRAPEDYPWAAYRYRMAVRAPDWLDHTELDRFIQEQTPAFLEPRASYRSLFGGAPSASELDWVERRLRAPEGGPGLGELDDLVGSASEEFQAWLQERTLLADGLRPGVPGASVIAVEGRVEVHRGRVGAWMVGPSRRRRCAWRMLSVGLMRDLCALPWVEIEERLGGGVSLAKRLGAEHRERMRADERYAWSAACIGQEAMRESCGASARGEALADESGQTRRRNRALDAVRQGGGRRFGGLGSDP